MIARIAAGLLLTLALPAFSESELHEPFAYSNMNPFVLTQGIPAARSPELAPAGRFSWQLQTEFANHFTESGNGSEFITLDGETRKVTLSVQYGVTDRLELGLSIPYVRHTGGSLDGFIENWHNTFGLPNGGREDIARDLLELVYRNNGETIGGVNRSAQGIGDVQLSAGYRLTEDADSAWTLRGMARLSSGDADDLTGSGAAGLYISVHHANAGLIAHPDWYFHASMGIALLGDGDVLGDLQEDWLVYGSTTLAWHITRRVSLKAQLDMHTAAYDSRLKELGDAAAQLVMGGSLQLTDNLLMDISVSEDIITDTSPDVVLQLGLRARF